MALWIPTFKKVDLGPDGGPYDETKHPKVALHTTEVLGWPSYGNSYPPHITAWFEKDEVRQHVDLHRHSYAFKKSESDDEFCVQIEMIGYAKETHTWSDAKIKWFALRVFKPIVDALKVPLIAKKFYGEMDGIVLATPTSPIRISDSELRNFSGFLGHQHMPAPDSHWDPGKFPIDKTFALLKEDDMELADKLRALKRPDTGVTQIHSVEDALNSAVWLYYHLSGTQAFESAGVRSYAERIGSSNIRPRTLLEYIWSAVNINTVENGALAKYMDTRISAIEAKLDQLLQKEIVVTPTVTMSPESVQDVADAVADESAERLRE